MTAQWLKNVRLEVGEKVLEDGTISTTTEIFHLQIEDGKIQNIVQDERMINGSSIDLHEKLAIPTFKEMHNHLDKTYLTLGWRACTPVANLKERLAHEASELPLLADTTEQRASAMIEKILQNGATHIRTHINIDPYIGLKNLEGVIAALEKYSDVVSADIIAFPQHGLLRDDVPNLLREALKSGATMIGGLDPAGIDKSIEKSLYTTMDIATQFNVDVDIHLHDGGNVGLYTIDKWLDIIEDANYQGRTALSHAFCLGDVTNIEQNQIAERLAATNTAIMSTVPINNKKIIPPIDLLDSKGVPVHFGCDGFFDSWSPYGSGDILEKSKRFAELSKKIDERSIRKSLKWITGGITPLNEEGKQVWPKVQDEASFVFTNASCSAEVVARQPHERDVMVRGEFIDQ